MTGEIEDIREWALSRFHWQQKSPQGEKLRRMIQKLADQYDFTHQERMDLGNALQAFADELITVFVAAKKRLAASGRNGPMVICCACTHGEAIQLNPPLCSHCSQKFVGMTDV